MIVDVECSGTGRHEDVNPPIPQKLTELVNLQSRILRHALKFPGLKKLAYSTCSVNVEENECVVEDVLRSVGEQFGLDRAMKNWTRRGLHGRGECLRTDPALDL